MTPLPGEARVVVLGGGMAGCAAALEAAEVLEGKGVVLLRRSLGATALSSGGIDLADDPGYARGDPLDREGDVARNLARLLDREGPAHPYALLGGGERVADLARAAWDRLARWTGGLVEGGMENAPLATSYGTYRFCAGAQATQRGGDLRKLAGKRLLVVGLAALPEFEADFVAQSLASLLPLEGASSVEVSWAPPADLGRGNPFEVARSLDEEDAPGRFAEAVARASEGRAYDALLLPPVVGLHRSREALRAISDRLGCAAFESLAGSPSVAGLRLQKALDRALEGAGVVRVDAEVRSLHPEGDRIARIDLADGRTVAVASGGGAVLATGGILGGGIVHDDGLRERLLDLPVFSGGRPARGLANDDLFGTSYGDRHPIFSSGLLLEARLRPSGGGGPLFENLFAAGDVVGGRDTVQGREGLGTALLLGIASGRAASGSGAWEGRP